MAEKRNSSSGVWLHRYAILVSYATFFLIIAGGMVTSTDSGLAVPDWPLSYGQIMPPMVGGIFYEHGHRMVATFVGMLTIVLALWLWRREERRWVRTLGWVALAAVVAQGLLGGLTVLLLLPTSVSVAHAALAQSFFCLTVVIAAVTSAWWKQSTPVEYAPARTTTRLSQALIVLVFTQLIIGAVMRHMNAGLAIPDFPLNYGQVIPPTGDGGIIDINDFRLSLDLTVVTSSQIWIHFAHRIGGLVVFLFVIITSLHVSRTYRHEGLMREPMIVVLLLASMQILLGALTVWTGLSVAVATAHVATGALLLASCVFLAIRTRRLYTFPVEVSEIQLRAEANA
jgi:cytochrome c oxidase assembly protein subunit 15